MLGMPNCEKLTGDIITSSSVPSTAVPAAWERSEKGEREIPGHNRNTVTIYQK